MVDGPTGAFISDTTAYTGQRAHVYWWQRQFGSAWAHARKQVSFENAKTTAKGFVKTKAILHAKDNARYGAEVMYNYTRDWYSKDHQNATGESRASLRFFRR